MGDCRCVQASHRSDAPPAGAPPRDPGSASELPGSEEPRGENAKVHIGECGAGAGGAPPHPAVWEAGPSESVRSSNTTRDRNVSPRDDLLPESHEAPPPPSRCPGPWRSREGAGRGWSHAGWSQPPSPVLAGAAPGAAAAVPGVGAEVSPALAHAPGSRGHPPRGRPPLTPLPPTLSCVGRRIAMSPCSRRAPSRRGWCRSGGMRRGCIVWRTWRRPLQPGWTRSSRCGGEGCRSVCWVVWR
jgi:hypothetical protein